MPSPLMSYCVLKRVRDASAEAHRQKLRLSLCAPLSFFYQSSTTWSGVGKGTAPPPKQIAAHWELNRRFGRKNIFFIYRRRIGFRCAVTMRHAAPSDVSCAEELVRPQTCPTSLISQRNVIVLFGAPSLSFLYSRY